MILRLRNKSSLAPLIRIVMWVVGMTIITLGCSSCTIYYPARFKFTYGDSTPCPVDEYIGWCVIQIPDVGFVAVNAYGHDLDTTVVNVRLVPKEGIEARWSLSTVSVIDKSSGASQIKTVLDTDLVTGGDQFHKLNDNLLINYGRAITSGFSINPRIRNTELKLPSILLATKSVAVPPIQYWDAPRFPILGPIYVE